ncbi:hypothetical protein AX16_008747 [Volvariella volvacea WC 439]|nr:hypothetical protein AX16_008747 [Volvariella volvacea WC 439]
MSASLLDAPPEIIQKIVLYATDATPVGPPQELGRFIQTCQTSRRTLTVDSSDLYTKILSQKFDVSPIVRRLGQAVVRANAREELQRRFTALKCFRQGERGLHDPFLKEHLWVAYFMLLDTDSAQKNVKQLLWAKLPDFIDAFLLNKLRDGSDTNSSWPLNNEVNSLAVAIKWLLSSCSTVKNKPQGVRREILRLLIPYVFATFRYPLGALPEHQFNTENRTISHKSSSSVHGPYPPPSPPSSQVHYFGSIKQTVPVPSIALHSILLHAIEFEGLTLSTPLHLCTADYKTRAEADANGHLGPTLEDVMCVAQNYKTNFPFDDAGIIPRSLTLTAYRLGDLTGRWKGSFFMPYLEEYKSWLNGVEAPNKPIDLSYCWHPESFSIQEYYTCDPLAVVPADKLENGALNAWVPQDYHYIQQSNGLQVVDQSGKVLAFYRSFRPEEPLQRDADVVDVILTGKADKRQAAAWEPFRILGRVRLSDGLVMMMKESLYNLGNSLLRGYVTPSRNLVGRMGPVSDGLAPADWGGAFSLGKEQAGTGGIVSYCQR